MSVYWVSGGTGTLGTALTLRLLAEGHKVRTFSRNEHNIEKLQRTVSEKHQVNLSCHVGSVEDKSRVARSMAGADFVVHAAAVKIIPIAEYNPNECVKTNIGGTQNVVDTCLDIGIKRAVFVSSDKARAASTLYGATKFCAERLWLASNRYRGSRGGIFSAVAWGNVWGSRGSVLHAFSQHAQFGALQVTDPAMTRFHITLHQAVQLVLDAVAHAEPGTLWIPKLPSYSIGDLARAFMKVYGIEREPVVTGRRPAEKVHEDLISENESCSVKRQVEDRHAERGNGLYVLEPGQVHEKGGWSYNSGSNPWRLTNEQLEKEIASWTGRSS